MVQEQVETDLLHLLELNIESTHYLEGGWD